MVLMLQGLGVELETRFDTNPWHQHCPCRLKSQESPTNTTTDFTPDEVRRLIEHAGKRGRQGQRDATLLMLAYRPGLRASELVTLRWQMVDLKQGRLRARLPFTRMKNSVNTVHPLRERELRALHKMAREYPDTPYVLVT